MFFVCNFLQSLVDEVKFNFCKEYSIIFAFTRLVEESRASLSLQNLGISLLHSLFTFSKSTFLCLVMGQTTPFYDLHQTSRTEKIFWPEQWTLLKSTGPKLKKSNVPILEAYMQVMGHNKAMGVRVLSWGTFINANSFYFNYCFFFKEQWFWRCLKCKDKNKTFL